jgi:hypothetical protein
VRAGGEVTSERDMFDMCTLGDILDIKYNMISVVNCTHHLVRDLEKLEKLRKSEFRSWRSVQ